MENKKGATIYCNNSMAPAELLNLQAIYYGLRNATQGLWGSDSNDTILVGIVASLDGIVGGISQDHQLTFVALFGSSSYSCMLAQIICRATERLAALQCFK